MQADQPGCNCHDVFYVLGMSEQESPNYRLLFWMSTSVAVALLAAFLTARGGEYRFYGPHEMSKYRDTEYTFTIDIYGYKYQGKTGDYIDDHILAYGAYEKDILLFMRDYVAARKNPDAVFLDVGACEGQHSLFMSRLVKQVHAFEPYPPAADRFQGLIDLNQFANIRLHRVGLGDKDANLPFFAPPEKNIGSGTFLLERKQGADKPVGNFRIVVGDEWLEPLQLPSLDLIKIDVEGYEKFVLQGLAKSIGRYRPVLVIEVNFPPIGRIANVAELRRLLPEGYQLLVFQLTGERAITGNYKLDPMGELQTGPSYCMVVAYPKERESMIRRDRK
jgi:FkbM family methyltransferase